MKTILIIEDDEMLNSGLCYNIELAGYEVGSAMTINDAKNMFPGKKWDLLLVDVNLPDGNGFEFGKWVREQSRVPLIFLTGNDLDENILEGFDAGADDYITKPFNIKIVLKRIEVLLSRTTSYGSTSKQFVCGNLNVDFDGMQITRQNESVELTPTEFRLLKVFCQNEGIVLTRDTLLEKLWDKDANFVDNHTLTINISRLKSKIKDDDYSYIKTIYGTGYQWIGAVNE